MFFHPSLSETRESVDSLEVLIRNHDDLAGNFGESWSYLLRCRFDQTGETGWICDGQFGQHFSVEADTGGFESMHKLAVRQIVHPCCRIDSGNPEAAKIPLSGLAVSVSVGKCTVNGVCGGPEQFAVAAAKPFGQSQHFISPSSCLEATFYSHFTISLILRCRVISLGIQRNGNA